MTSERTRPTTSQLRLIATVAAASLVCACASGPRESSREYLDEATAATVTVSSESLVFARERPELAVHARDYLTLVPIDVNRGGTHHLYFYGYAWSTIDKRGTLAAAVEAQRFDLVADGQSIPLVPVPTNPRELGIAKPPVRPPAASADLLVVSIDPATLQLLAHASDVHAVAQSDGLSAPYELWSGRPGSLLALR
jgi:hypothetical protein